MQTKAQSSIPSGSLETEEPLQSYKHQLSRAKPLAGHTNSQPWGLISPLEPHRAMVRGLLLLSSSRRQALPAWSRITDSSFRIRAWARGQREENAVHEKSCSGYRSQSFHWTFTENLNDVWFPIGEVHWALIIKKPKLHKCLSSVEFWKSVNSCSWSRINKWLVYTVL